MGGSTPASDTPSLTELLSGQAALDNASSAAPGIGYAAGSSAAQGALDTLAGDLGPYLPLIVVGLAVLLLAL